MMICLGFLATSARGQAIPDKFIPKGKAKKSTPSKSVTRTVQKPETREEAGQEKSTAPKPVTRNVQKPETREEAGQVPEVSPENSRPQPVRVAPSGLESLFETSDDCVLEIDGRWLGTLTKAEPKTFMLAFGQHKVQAQHKGTKEIFTTQITVLRNNQVFNISFQSSLPSEANLDFAKVTGAQSQSRDAIKISGEEVLTPPVPAYVNRSSELQTLRELSSNMVAVRGGKYPRGENKKKRDSVAVKDFQMGRYEVTQQQWQQVMGYNNSDNKNCSDCPVENVSWNEIQDFIQKLNETGGVKFRLPTSAEWELAARMDTREYIDKRGGRKYGDNVAWNENNAQRKTHSVGTRIPHRVGTYDMMGNVAEWCSDWYDADYLKGPASLDNPSGASKGTKKIVRGGNYANANFVELSSMEPNEKKKTVGFRLVQY